MNPEEQARRIISYLIHSNPIINRTQNRPTTRNPSAAAGTHRRQLDIQRVFREYHLLT